MIQAVYTLLFVFLALFFGRSLGSFLSPVRAQQVAKLLSPLVLLLFFTIGISFGLVLNSASAFASRLYQALFFAFLTTLVPFLLICIANHFFFLEKPIEKTHHSSSSPSLLISLKDSSFALLAFLAGAILINYAPYLAAYISKNFSIIILYVILFTVGIELAHVKFSRSSFGIASFLVPLCVLLGSFLGGSIGGWGLGLDWTVSLALSSGFGWFSLSSVVFANNLGDAYGILALLTDLFRELFAIIVIYVLGRYFPLACVGTAAATSFDSTLPMIKQVCPPYVIPVAFVNGLSLTLIAPVLIPFFLHL